MRTRKMAYGFGGRLGRPHRFVTAAGCHQIVAGRAIVRVSIGGVMLHSADASGPTVHAIICNPGIHSESSIDMKHE